MYGKQEDVLSVLNSIDRGNPVGKRDYAIMMLITRYGLRSVDVKNLKLSDLRWSANVIEIVQSKTRNPLRLPLLRDVGWAIIDYLQNGRPASEHPELFLTCTVPDTTVRPSLLRSERHPGKTSPAGGRQNLHRSTQGHAFSSAHACQRNAGQ